MSRERLHLCQVGYDESVFSEKGQQDTLCRQLAYATMAAKLSPGTSMSYIVVTPRRDFAEYRYVNAERDLRLIPITVSGPADARSLMEKLSRLHAERPFDILAPQDIAGSGKTILAFARKNHIPIVGQLHYDLFSPYAQRQMFGRRPGLMHFRRWAVMNSLPQYSALRVVSTRVENELKKQLPDLPVRTIPVPATLGLELNLMRPEKIAASKPQSELVLFVGRLAPEKNLSLWLEIAGAVRRSYPNARFRIIGDGPVSAESRRNCQDRGLADCVEFTGAVPYNELGRHYQEASVFLLTSHYEGFGRVLVEAARYGTVPVSTQVAGSLDVVRNRETGFLHPAEDKQGLTESVLTLLRDRPLREKMGLAAIEDVRARYQPETLQEKWMQMLLDFAAR